MKLHKGNNLGHTGTSVTDFEKTICPITDLKIYRQAFASLSGTLVVNQMSVLIYIKHLVYLFDILLVSLFFKYS